MSEGVTSQYLLRRHGRTRSGGSGRSLGTRSRATKVLRPIRTRSVIRHAHVVRRGRSRSVRGANSRVVLGAAPAQADSRVANGIALHLVDGHFGSMAVDKLDEAAALAGGDLDVGDLSKALEERSKLILGNIAREPADKHRRVVWVGELVHLRRRVVAAIGEALHLTPHGLLRNAAHHGTAAAAAALLARCCESLVTAVLGSSGRDSHRSVTAVNTLHLNQGALLVVLVGEPNEPVASALARHGIRHDLGRLARGEASLEKRDKHVFINLGAEVTNEDAILGATVVASVHKATARRPVKLELARTIRDRTAIKTECLVGGIRVRELHETVAGITRVLVANHLDVDSLSGRGQKNALNEILIHPRLQLTHPESGLGLLDRATGRGRHGGHV